MVVQHLYHEMNFDSPFLIVYIGTSLFSVFLPIRLGYERFGHLLHKKLGDGTNDIVVIPWGNYPAPTTSRSLDHHDDESVSVNDAQELMRSPTDNGTTNGNGMIRNNSKESIELSYLDESTSAEASALGILDDFSFNNDYCIQYYEPKQKNEESRLGNSDTSQSTSDNNNFSTYLLSHRDHISMASKVAPMWFLSNYFYAMSLEWTSIASSTVLASMGSIFAFGFATCSKLGDETITRNKLMGVILCFMGGVATTYTDSGGDNNNNNNSMRHLTGQFHVSDLNDSTRSLLGDLCGLVSAIGYGAYTNLLRHLCPKDEDRMSMQLLFGYIGLLNMVVLLPVAIWVNVSSHNDDYNSEDSEMVEPSNYADPDHTQETTSHVLTMPIFLFLLLKGLLDNVLSDYLWARAVILTSATVASVGVGLTIPMAFAADYFMGNYNGSSQSGEVWGAILVLIGFVFVNIDGFKQE